MRSEDLLTHAPSPEAVAKETQMLPEPSAEALAALRQTLEASARPTTPTPWPALLQEARGKMDSRHAGPVTSHRGGVSGLALVLAKRAFRLVFQPFINESLRKQVEFNESILDALATIHDVQREHARTQATWRQDVERRLARMEDAARGLATGEAHGRVTPASSTTRIETRSSSPGKDNDVASPHASRKEDTSVASSLASREEDNSVASPHASREKDSAASSSRAPRQQGASNEAPEPPPRSSGGSSRRRSGRR